jgi:hypothetical protein
MATTSTHPKRPRSTSALDDSHRLAPAYAAPRRARPTTKGGQRGNGWPFSATPTQIALRVVKTDRKPRLAAALSSRAMRVDQGGSG